MRMNTQEAVLSAYIASIGKRTPREAAQDAAELFRKIYRSRQRTRKLIRVEPGTHTPEAILVESHSTRRFDRLSVGR